MAMPRENSQFHDIDFLLEIVDDRDDFMTIVVVGTGNRVPTVLNVRTLRVDTTVSRTSELKIVCLRTKRRLSSLKWEGEIQVSHRTVRSKDELKSELENSASVYGVWGENSRAFFENWLNAKVIDISFCFVLKVCTEIFLKDINPSEITEVLEEELPEFPLSTVGMFSRVISNNFEEFRDENMENAFSKCKKWIETLAWETLMGHPPKL
ncbi:hypothetical protein AVEN_216806-1 [Araneus ventricosus]|uniref:Uncharacterized protein n=1 Tax=Araneus ventricosus TaxID=182803 RepID=A0A4Y2LU16_ARAVE|nr:hypothetical protein AVEN_216806-1 [Araneus ventricosus]